MNLIRLEVGDISRLIGICQQFRLDFDDAYQYTAAEKYNLSLVSFDRDFDETIRGRKLPGDFLNL